MLAGLLARRASLVAVALTCALAACGDAGTGESVGENEAPVAGTFPNDKTACDYFVAKGLSSFQAAGIVGNLDQESGASPAAVQSGGPGRGIAQWSVGGRWDTDSGDNAIAYASQQGQSVYALGLQLDFIWYELTTFPSYGLTALRQSTNVSAATIAFETDFEGCGQCDESQRIAYAQAILPSCSSPAYAAQYVSQSFPLATTTMTMTAGQVIPSYIELKNVGSKAWDSNTRLGTTQPRDRQSAFAGSNWISPSRPAGVVGTVPPGGTYKFAFDLVAPDKAGTYDEFFGVVEEGVAWFSDPGQGGPVDDDLEVKIDVVASSTPPDAGEPAGDAEASDAATGGTDGADGTGATSPTGPTGGVTLGGARAADAAADGAGANPFDAGAAGGCTIGASLVDPPPSGLVMSLMLLAGGLAARRRRLLP